MRRAGLVVLAMFGLGSTLARADAYTTFDVSAGFLQYGMGTPVDSSLSGTVVIDETVGKFVAADLIAVTPVGNVTLSQVQPGGSEEGTWLNTYSLFISGSSANYLGLSISTPTLVGYAGGPICGLALENCPSLDGHGFLVSDLDVGTNNGSYFGDAESGELTPIVATPEPGSMALLGTGALGFVQLARRRRG